MKKVLKLSLLLSLMLFGIQSINAQTKKVKSFEVERIIPQAAHKVWAVVGEDYGAIAKSHPKIIKSEYIDGTLKAGEGAQRICYFNESGSQFVKEKMINYDSENMTFLNTIYQTGKFPLDPENSSATYKVEPIDANTCKFTFNMTYRTKPAFMGGMMKGKFRNLISDYMVSVEHHLSTGEDVTKENFKDVKKLYATR